MPAHKLVIVQYIQLMTFMCFMGKNNFPQKKIIQYKEKYQIELKRYVGNKI